MQQPVNPLLKALLSPLSLLYGIGVFVRNLCFEWGIFKSQEFLFPVISVGNITVGGTGKTPHVEHIVSFLKDQFRVAVLSRGYKRITSGFVVASVASGVDDVGDEPLQIKKKFPSIEVAVDEKRVRGIRKLCLYNRKLEAFVLDDAFQHRWVRPGLSVLLVDYSRPLNKDTLLPAGRLREFVSAKNRAEIVVVTKCQPDIKPIERRIMMTELNLFPWQSLYFTSFSYGDPLPVFSEGLPFPEREELKETKPHLLMVTGIVSPRPLKKHLRSISSKIKQFTFPDHHKFTRRDIDMIGNAWNSLGESSKFVMTTEKDAMRLQKIGNIEPEIKRNMYYIPVTIQFVEGTGDSFKNKITEYVGKNKKDHILC